MLFEDWTLRADGQVLARQFDNLTRTLVVKGEIPSDWEWTMLVQVGEMMDILPLTPGQEGLGIVLTAQQLSVSGYYTMQLRGSRGELVRHTNTINVYVPASLTGDEKWPAVPSEFTDLERRATEAAQKAEKAAAEAENGAEQAATAGETAAQAKAAAQQAQAAAGQSAANASASEHAAAEHKKAAEQATLLAGSYANHPPVIGENGNWWEWDGVQYADSGKPSRGELSVRQGNALYANALKGTASGTTVRLDEVSPLEHIIPVMVSNVDNPTAVKVTASGKNFVNAAAYAKASTTATTVDGDVFTTTFTSAGIHVNAEWLKPVENPPGTYTVTFVPLSEGACAGIYVYAADDNATIAFLTDAGLNNKTSLTFTANKKFYVALSGASNKVNRGTHSYKLQLEVGRTATQYEPYIAPVTYTPAEDGTYEVRSIAPTMTLTTDTDGAVMGCAYNRDINKAFEQVTQAIISMGGNI